MLINEFVSKQTRLGALRALQCTLKLFHALFYIFFQRLCTYFHEHSEPVHTRSVQHCSLVYSFSGPQWYRKGSSTKLLFASRRSDDARRRKTAGNIADGLRCCIWRRAEKPEKMRHQLVWGGKNQTGYIALLHPSVLASDHPRDSRVPTS